MGSELLPSALVGDHDRMAVGSIYGYAYQFLHSVFAWLDLSSDEVLFLEGAEDFDVVGPDGAVAVQVKSSTRSVSLRSLSVVQAIDSFWSLRLRHGDGVRFRYLTRAGVGVEQGVPFGSGVAGLNVWVRGRRDDECAEAVRSFLLAEGRVSEEVLCFLRGACPAEVRSCLLVPVGWETECPDGSAVEAAIRRKLVCHGDAFGVSPSDSAAVVSRLLREVLSTAGSRCERSLGRADFLSVFEEETSVRLPKCDVRSLLHSASLVGEAFLAGAPVVAVDARSPLESGVPRLFGVCAARVDLVAELVRRVVARDVLVVFGSSGMGKSTLAKLVTRDVAGAWSWFDCGAAVDGVLPVLRRAGAFLDSVDVGVGLVLDGFSVGGSGVRAVEDDFCGLLYAARARGVLVVVTSHRPLPDRLLSRCGLEADSNWSVRSLTEDDIVEFAVLLGCSEPVALAWVKFLGVQTGGHPQLVHARLVGLSRRSWPMPSSDDLDGEPADLVQERDLARDLLRETASDALRDFLFRLSVLLGLFRKDHAVQIALLDPGLAHPGDLFDQLVGPWLEPVGSGYFRLSPLLTKAYSAVWSPEHVLGLRAGVAGALLRCDRLTPIEVSEILFQGLFGQAAEPVGAIAASLVFSSDEDLRSIADHLFWLPLWAIDTGKRAFPDDPVANHCVRLLQFKFALATRRDLLPGIADVWEQETLAEALEDEDDVRHRLLMVANLCLYHEELAAERLVRLLAEFAKVTEADAAPVLELPELGAGTTDDPVTELFRIAVFRNASPRFLGELLPAVAAAPEALRRRLLVVFESRAEDARLLVDRVWIGEAKKERPDWDGCLATLRAAYDFGRHWVTPVLAPAAAAASSVIFDEYLDDEVAALKSIEDAEHEIGPSPILTAQRGIVALNRKRYAEAFAVWDSLFPEKGPAANVARPVFSCRNGGIAAAHLGKWSRAAKFYQAAASQAEHPGYEPTIAGLFGDAGYAHWKAEEFRSAIDAFNTSLELLGDLPNPESDLASHVLSKRIGHVLLWLERTLSGDCPANLRKPVIGMCSDPDYPKEMQELPATPVEISWVLLMGIEYELEAGNGVFDQMMVRLASSTDVFVRIPLAELDIKHSLRKHEINRVVEQCRKLNEAVATARERQDSEQHEPAQGQYSTTLLLGALLVLAGTDRFETANDCLASWGRNAARIPQTNPIRGWLEVAEKILATPQQATQQIMLDPAETWDRRMVAAIKIGADPTAKAESIFCAHLAVFEWLQYDMFEQELTPQFLTLLTRQWTHKTQNPAALRTPRLSVPRLKEACERNQRSKQKTATILLAARDAVDVKISNNLLALLQETQGE